MFMNITTDNWAILWGAFIGAVLTGGAAAWVAMRVLRKTREDQAALTKTQLEEQRREAAKEREIAARAELIGLLSEFGFSFRRGVTIDYGELSRRIDTVIQRWRMNLDGIEDAEMRTELQAWAGKFIRLQIIAAPDPLHGAGQAMLHGALDQLQAIAINYRETVGATVLTSETTASRLKGLRDLLEKFIADHYKNHDGN